jgi:hypothetical protein
MWFATARSPRSGGKCVLVLSLEFEDEVEAEFGSGDVKVVRMLPSSVLVDQ